MTTDQDMWALPSVYAGARSPEGVRCTIWRSSAELNLAAVSAVRFVVTAEATGHQRTWPAVIVSQWADRLVARYEFAADGNDVRTPGRYRILPELLTYVPGATPEDPPVLTGVRRAQPFYLAVKP